MDHQSLKPSQGADKIHAMAGPISSVSSANWKQVRVDDFGRALDQLEKLKKSRTLTGQDFKRVFQALESI